MKKHLRRRCILCGLIFPVYREGDVKGNSTGYASGYRNLAAYVMWIPDPFAEEIHGDFTSHWECGACAEISMWEI